MAVDFGIGGTGKTWIAEAPEPLALANSLARQGIAQQGRAQRDSISLNRNRSAAKSLDATGRDTAMKDLSIPQVGLFQPQLNADYKEGLDDINSRFQPGVNDAQIRDELRNYKLKMEGLSGQYKAYGDEINKSIETADQALYNKPALLNHIVSRVNDPKNNYRLTKTPNGVFSPTEVVKEGFNDYHNIYGNEIGNRMLGKIENITKAYGSHSGLGGGTASLTQIPAGSKLVNGKLEFDPITMNQLWTAEIGGPQHSASLQAEILKDPTHPFTKMVNKLDARLAKDPKFKPQYDEAMEKNKYANLVVPYLGGEAGLSTRFPQVHNFKKQADRLLKSEEERLELLGQPTVSSVRINKAVPGFKVTDAKGNVTVKPAKGAIGGQSYTTRRFTVPVTKSDQDQYKEIKIGGGYTEDVTGKLVPVAKTNYTNSYGVNKGLSEGNLSIESRPQLRRGGDFKAVKADGTEVLLDYQPKAGAEFDPAKLAKSIEKAGGVELKINGGRFSVEDFLSNRDAVEVVTYYALPVAGIKHGAKGDIKQPAKTFYWRTDQRPDLGKVYNRTSETPADQIIQDLIDNEPLNIYKQARPDDGGGL